ncbi:MAG TPA: shikimate kinase [Perlabentimonas sp.]|jgi:shikimate kinase|nr:shikimate kinase [Bacteroidales bacterium]MDD4673024.1 shikimate kinase [Bacteroidales bacterium]MDY0348074.1 shikimate kinase [Tenuifilaceae bacterium]HZJ74279.1 shikimate kinase [Perlabentimonas sp.]
MKVFLIGFMASGKTTLGEKLAKELGFKFIDLDQYIERREGKTIKELFEIRGEEHFRKIESEALREVSALDKDHVIASGGGTSCFYNSVDFMNKVGITIYLRAEVPELVARLIKAKDYRPLLWGKSKDELSSYIIRVLDERKKYYERAKIAISINDTNVKMLANTIRATQS